jgi:hypothetical protein
MHSLTFSTVMRPSLVGALNGPERQEGAQMQKHGRNTVLGKLVFTATAVAMVYFFWWLLIFDHGVISIQ